MLADNVVLRAAEWGVPTGLLSARNLWPPQHMNAEKTVKVLEGEPNH